MLFDPEKVPGVGELILIDIEENKKIRGEFDKLFEDVEGLCTATGKLDHSLI